MPDETQLLRYETRLDLDAELTRQIQELRAVRSAIRKAHITDANRRGQKMRQVLAERRAEIIDLRFNQRKSLQEIADIFGVTRERIRQIVGNSGKNHGGFNASIIDRVPQLANDVFLDETSGKTNGELAQELGVKSRYVARRRTGIRHAVEPGDLCNGMRWEDWVAQRLSESNIPCKLMLCHHEYDILAFDNIRINVKHTDTARKPPSNKVTSPQYAFNTKGKDNCDFLILVIAQTQDVFVVPSSVVTMKKNTQIIFCWPTLRPTMAKWQLYHNRFDLILKAAQAGKDTTP